MSRSDSSDEKLSTHLRQLDHWTFLLALGLVTANIVVVSPYLSAAAAVFLLIALGYDAYEFYR
jgi:hypothetical protein